VGSQENENRECFNVVHFGMSLILSECVTEVPP
jgi:hypothetical protein